MDARFSATCEMFENRFVRLALSLFFTI